MLNLNDVACFVRVVDHGGFAPASRELGLPKSTLSKRVSELEKALGVRLIHRTSRSFNVTDVGEAFYRHAAAMLVEAEAAEDVVKGRLAEPAGTVRISASIPTAQTSLSHLLPLLALDHPKVRLVLEASDRFVDAVQEGFDIVLRDHFAPLADSGLVQRRLGFEAISLVASREYLNANGTPAQPADLGEHDTLVVSRTTTSWRLGKKAGDETREVALQPRYSANESLALLTAARKGLGITCLPHRFCRGDIAAGTLVHVLPDWSAGGVTTTLLMPHRRGQLPAVRAVADFLIERIPSELEAERPALP